jgi:hypothetical protein
VDLQKIHKLTESVIATRSNIVTPMEKQMVRRFLESIFQVYACADGTCSVIVHTLTCTDVNKKQMVRVTSSYFLRFLTVLFPFLIQRFEP